MSLKDFSFTKEWTLFLDRDGVINRRIPGGYVTAWADFEFLEGVPGSIAILSEVFGRIIVVSNQQGVGKGLMSLKDLEAIDLGMKSAISQAGGRIDAAFYSPYLESADHPDRKPGTGMAHKAKIEFPEIDFSRSVMAGDSASDMEFGRNLGMVTVWIGETHPEISARADLRFESLKEFALCMTHRTSNNLPNQKP
jgi:D-glycero-D-manno-heptose 1,7-bisphosphate phosphatase